MAECQIPSLPPRYKSTDPWLGRRYGRWTVVGESERALKDAWVPCRCECGTERRVMRQSLTRGLSTSCRCKTKEVARTRQTRHGMSGSSIHNIWMSMIGRCNTPSHSSYERYGARGIRVCDRWANSFETFLSDIGPRPSLRHSLDRRDVNGHYEPGNVVWATSQQQNRNRRDNLRVTYDGREICAAELAEIVGREASLVCEWLRKGISPSAIAAHGQSKARIR